MSSIVLGVLEILLAVQPTQASIVGTVRDEETGAPLAGVVLTLADVTRSTVSGEDGAYEFRDVPAGPQHVTVEHIGYADRTLHALVPRSGRLELNLSLRPEPIPLEPVRVQTRVPVRGVEDDAPAERRVSIAAVRSHPLLAEPDGVLALTGGEVLAGPETPTGLHVRGGAADQTAWVLDGIPVFNPYHVAGVFSAWNPDALARLDLHSAAPSLSLPPALSGVVTAVTRPAGRRLRGRGRVSTTHASLTLDGPFGEQTGWLVSLRSGYPDMIAPGESSYLRGQASDWLAKLDTDLLGGTLSLLGFSNRNGFDAASVAHIADTEGDTTPATSDGDGLVIASPRNRFGWNSRSFGATWTRESGPSTLLLRAWSASTEASAAWTLDAGGASDLATGRRDQGAVISVAHRATGVTDAGLRIERSRTDYEVIRNDSQPTIDAAASTPLVSVYAEHERPVGDRVRIEVGGAITGSGGRAYASPRARFTLQPVDRLTLSGSYARLQQFAQSLRNAESVVGIIFPADLYVGSSTAGVSVALSDQAVLSLEFRPAAGWRIGMRSYVRSFDGLLLPAPAEGEPFALTSFTTGSGAARGVSLDASVSGARFGALASWGWRDVRLKSGASMWIPGHGVAHNLEAGVIFFPTATSSIRVGATGQFGRLTTPVPGRLEWESCNVLDRGCEFAGSPHYGDTTPGSARLPTYFRIDAGYRKHWHIETLGRDAELALYGTITNLLGRSNALTLAADPVTGERVPVEMRPRGPLVVGLDWRF